MPESTFLQPENIASTNGKPYGSFVPAYALQTSRDKFLQRSDLVPSGKVGNPVKAPEFARCDPHNTSGPFTNLLSTDY